MNKRTIVDIESLPEVWSQLDAWAQEYGYKLMEFDDYGRLYQKGTGFLVAPMMLSVRKDGARIRLEA